MGPDFKTANRVRPYKVKSSARLRMNIPNFKARPVSKKILEAPTSPALPRSTPHLTEFQEFHLKTSERANQHAESSHQLLLVKNFASSKMCVLFQIGLNAAQDEINWNFWIKKGQCE
ncbi:hypothetical protein MKW98_024324 [Papaver atlanticum]|uniref:TPX2 central domain-containing protein n=1 Tax=Papaver atlanticum TaxID=357466 RepID=A0AAD4SY65_9MAGN|nr:hypothetical protein MKW98_024324 [Papaver atlanticum]